jgi:glycosyltransferase involved in cell wall biosynthesis
MQSTMRSWLFFPNFTGGSPYQGRLAETLAAHGWSVAPGDIAAAILATGVGPAVFHLHWEQPIYGSAVDEADAAASAHSFLRSIDSFRAAGGLVVWTLHNAYPHEERFPAVNEAVQRGLARCADIIHAHNDAGVAHAEMLGAPLSSVTLARHPSYAETYPNDITDEAARRYLGLGDGDIVFAFFGAMRGYKGLPRLVRAFNLVHPMLPATRLVLAGRCPDPCAARFLAPEPGLRLLSRQISDAEVQYVIRAADCVVLPYESILTSGALALAHGFSRPVIVPNLPSMLEEVKDGENGFIYAVSNEAALTLALWRAADNLAAVRGPMRDAAHASVADRDFAGLAAALAGAVEAAWPTRHAA